MTRLSNARPMLAVMSSAETWKSGNEMSRVARDLFQIGIALAAPVVGVFAGTLMVRFVFPAPAVLLGGWRVGTPVQSNVFLATFLLATPVVIAIGLRSLAHAKDAPMATCGKCNDGWICEDHPNQPAGHHVTRAVTDDPYGNRPVTSPCGGARIPCDNPDCLYSITITKVVCPRCSGPYGRIEHKADRLIRFQCRACLFVWRTQMPAEGSDQSVQ